MLTYALIENQETGRFYVGTAADALPMHWTSDEYETIEAAKAAHPHEWQEPDDECSPDVVAVAVEK